MTVSKRTSSRATSDEMPQFVRLVRPFGFVAEDGTEYFWRIGQKVVDPREIELLVQNGAEIEVQKCRDP